MNKKRDAGVYLEDILESITRIEKNTKRCSREEFEKDRDKQDAVVHRLEIIGEAVKNIPKEIRDAHPQIPWREIAGTRDKIIHHYFEIDIDQVWSIIEKDLQPLKRHVEEMLREINSRS